MKNVLFLLIVLCLTIVVSCSKDTYSEELPTPDNDRFISLSRQWELQTYIIKTDRKYHPFSRTEVLTHALRTLTFHDDGTYTAADAAWSGTFELFDDNTQLLLKPGGNDWIPMHFTIDHFSRQQIQFSTPVVNVNPVNADAIDYEKLIAFQGLSWLYNRNIDTLNIRTLRIQFTYY